MGENTAISWATDTFNPWIGCTRVSPGCQHCYAEAFAKRYGKAEWGPTAQRVRTSAANWRKPIIWNRKAAAEGVRRRVFCASLADVFEDNPQVETWRAELFGMIEQTSSLDWLLLTKRPENVNEMVPGRWRTVGRWPANVWVGTTIENQAAADKRIPELLSVPTLVHFLSCEPLLGPVSLAGHLGAIEWVIAGGESGPQARPMNPDWVRRLRDQCVAAGVPFHFKQWGGLTPKANGRELDGRIWDECP